MGEVRSLHGDAPPILERNESCIAELRELLEKAESGEIVGFSSVQMHRDRGVSYTVAGMAGGFGMLGALEMIRAELVAINWGFDE